MPVKAGKGAAQEVVEPPAIQQHQRWGYKKSLVAKGFKMVQQEITVL